MKDLFRLKTLVAACAVVMLTVSCGSSSDDSTPPPTIPTPPPVDTMAQEDAAASASVAGFIAFIQSLVAAMTSDSNEPRNIGGITPAVTETAEPAAI
jgi:hypothetical protein